MTAPIKSGRSTTYTHRKMFELSLPVLFAYFPLGLVFGVLSVHQGFSKWLTIAMSATIYAGAVQFVTLTMLDNGASLTAILLATFFVAFRNVFYGISFIDRYKRLPWLFKWLLSFGLVDATYAILTAHPKAPLRFCIKLTALIYLYWQLGTILGALGADWLPEMKGLAFILPCFFMVLVIDFYFVHRSFQPIILPIFFSVMCYAYSSEHYLVLSIVLSVGYLYGYRIWSRGE